MWRWSPKRLPKRIQFLLQFVAFVLFLHIVFFLLFFVYEKRSKNLGSIGVNSGLLQNRLDYVVLPYVRHVSSKELKKAIENGRPKAVVSSHCSKRSCGQVINSSKTKSSIQRTEKASRLVAPMKTIEQSSKALIVKNNVAIISKVCPVKKTKEIEKKKAVLDLPVKQVEEQKQQLETKSSTIAARPFNAEALVESTSSQPVVEERVSDVQQPPEVVQDVYPELGTIELSQGPLYIGKDDLKLIELHDSIAEEMHTHWHPPSGIQPQKTCKIKVFLAEDGTVKKLQQEQSSGILAYDMAARVAIMKAKFSEGAWNNEFTLSF
jgi:hypothetical protein